MEAGPSCGKPPHTVVVGHVTEFALPTTSGCLMFHKYALLSYNLSIISDIKRALLAVLARYEVA